eukprot:4339301-Karenia_brevis.AAC.1
MHDYELDSSSSRDARSELIRSIASARKSPLSFVVFLLGDINRGRDGELRHYLDPIDQAEYLSCPSLHVENHSSENNAWDSIFATVHELATHNLTHYSSKGRYENRLDRIFTTLPTWALRQLSVVTPHFMSAYQYHSNKLSDHSPVGVIISPRSSLPPPSRSIPSFVTKHPIYKQIIRLLEDK